MFARPEFNARRGPTPAVPTLSLQQCESGHRTKSRSDRNIPRCDHSRASRTVPPLLPASHCAKKAAERNTRRRILNPVSSGIAAARFRPVHFLRSMRLISTLPFLSPSPQRTPCYDRFLFVHNAARREAPIFYFFEFHPFARSLARSRSFVPIAGVKARRDRRAEKGATRAKPKQH